MDRPNPLDYGPPPKRKYAVSRRELGGAFFILLAIPPGFILIASFLAVIRRAVMPAEDENAPGIWMVVIYAGAIGAISGLLCFVMVRSALRRLRPPNL